MGGLNTVELMVGRVLPTVLCLVLAGGCGSSALPSSDGSAGTGGSVGSGGTPGTGGATGGSPGTGGASTGGAPGTGGATGGAPGTGGSPATGGAPGTGGSPGDGGTGCNCGVFAPYRKCCGSRCVNPANDPLNCGDCGNRCPADKPLCDGGTCKQPACNITTCNSGTCCGSMCCSANQLCCDAAGPISGFTTCHTITTDQPTCPAGCAPLCVSDRNLKQAIEPVDPQEVLERLSRLPISRWRYRTEADNIRHMGPMAQDFKQAFGLGDTDRAYNPIDAHGVAFAAIQALQQLADEQQRRIDKLEREKRTLERRLRALETRAQ
jgi:hypothetical protein